MSRDTVYLIDDEPAMLELLGDVVELAGLNARGYSRASHFFEQITVFEADSILVLDLQMPGMDGIEVMRRLARMEHPPALVLISGQDIGVLHAAEKLGQAHSLKILASLGKPVPIDRFMRLLQQHALDSSGKHPDVVQTAKFQPTSDELHRAIQEEQLIPHYQPQHRRTYRCRGPGTLAAPRAGAYLSRLFYPFRRAKRFDNGLDPLGDRQGGETRTAVAENGPVAGGLGQHLGD